ncbi:MAG: AMP-binding protein [Jatrophihabitantaceae bacterium]
MLTDATGSPLSVLAEQSWARFGDRSTMRFEGRRWSAAELGALARRLAAGLRGLGVRPGDRVVVCMANCPEVTVTYHAAWRIGAVVTPVLFLLSEDELRHVLSDSGARIAVTTPEFAAKVHAASAGLEVDVVVSGEPSGGALSLAELASGDEAALVRADPGEMAALLYTGGTTGRSKGVVISHDALSNAAWSATLSGVEDELTVSLLPLPLAHVFGLMVSTMALHVVRPGHAVLMRWFEPLAWLELAQSERVQTGAVVPTMLRLLAAAPLEDYDLSALRRLASGSAPLPADVSAEWDRRVPHVEIGEGYGCTETAALATSSPSGRVRRGSVGRAAPRVELRIERVDGTDARVDEDGEICVRSASLMTGYWHAPQETATALRDGWFHSGDLGHLDADGYLFVVDRIKDVIIRGGFNVYPRDVEEVFTSHPDVANCAVIGREDREHGEEVIAFVQLRPGASTTADELRAFGREHLSAVKYPREVHLIEQLPLTSIGKLDRKALRVRTPSPGSDLAEDRPAQHVQPE